MTTTVDVEEAKQQLSKLLELVSAGNEVIIADGKTPIARLSPAAPAGSGRRPRVAGLHPGAITVSDDFDEALPDEFWLGSR